MRRELLHTPEGVRDIYNGEYDKKQRIEQELHQTFLSFGYHTIQTPTFEFFDVFNREIGTIPSKDLYKFTRTYGRTRYQTINFYTNYQFTLNDHHNFTLMGGYQESNSRLD